MINSFTGYIVPQEGSALAPIQNAQPPIPTQLNTLTLEHNSVLIARFSKDSRYDVEDFETIRRMLKDAFPCHTVLLMYDDIELTAVNDKAYKAERIPNDTSNYY